MYPGLFQASDSSAIGTQKHYVHLVVLQLVLTCACALSGALGTALGPKHPGLLTPLRWTSVALSLAGVSVLLAIKLKGEEAAWFENRALAESTKSLTWLFIMRSSPFDTSNEDDAKSVFQDKLNSITKVFSQTFAKLPAAILNKPNISEGMVTIRASNLEERKATYRAHRIQDQRNWYFGKAEYFDKLDTKLVIPTFLFYSVVVLTLAVLGVDALPVTAAAMAIAASLSAYRQLKRPRDLSAAYKMAARELQTADENWDSIKDEPALAALVASVEHAISREHTMWQAKPIQIIKMIR